MSIWSYIAVFLAAGATVFFIGFVMLMVSVMVSVRKVQAKAADIINAGDTARAARRRE